MGRRSVRPVSILLTSCIAASLFTGCDMPWGKKKVQQEAVEAYLGACLEFDYRTAASLVDDKDDAFQDIVLESPQRDICELVMSRAQFEVLKVDNDRALVKLTMPDIDRALKRENIPALELEDLEDIIDISTENMVRLKEDAGAAEPEQIFRYIRVFSELTSQIRYASQRRVLIEVALIRLCRPETEKKDDALYDRIVALEDFLFMLRLPAASARSRDRRCRTSAALHACRNPRCVPVRARRCGRTALPSPRAA